MTTTLSASGLASVLLSDGPDPRYAQELQTFGRFVGSWDVELTEYSSNGDSETSAAEWHFGWVLAGRAVQDVWITPPIEQQRREGVPPREWGTMVRYYDPSADCWRLTWAGPGKGRQILLIAREEDDQIVLEGEEHGHRIRWVFSEIRENSFLWESHEEQPDGSWQRVQQMRACRR
jgi:hypothetical protein